MTIADWVLIAVGLSAAGSVLVLLTALQVEALIRRYRREVRR